MIGFILLEFSLLTLQEAQGASAPRTIFLRQSPLGMGLARRVVLRHRALSVLFCKNKM